jgi:3-mercaptopyruvate sulfurtransferase SseA
VPLGVQTGLPGEVPTNDIAIPPAVPTGSPPPADDPPRMQLGDFKALYDDPATRPIIIDTRNEAAFAEGHIPGAILFPSTEVENNVATLPKDKLIVAYCQ